MGRHIGLWDLGVGTFVGCFSLALGQANVHSRAVVAEGRKKSQFN